MNEYKSHTSDFSRSKLDLLVFFDRLVPVSICFLFTFILFQMRSDTFSFHAWISIFSKLFLQHRNHNSLVRSLPLYFISFTFQIHQFRILVIFKTSGPSCHSSVSSSLSLHSECFSSTTELAALTFFSVFNLSYNY